jgi:uncharacterized protein (DUF1330 family)
VASERFVVVAVFDVAPEAVTAFQTYEEAVMPLLARHDGQMERRLRGAAGETEVHVLSFPSPTAWREFLDDPERARHRAVLTGATVEQRVLDGLTDVR